MTNLIIHLPEINEDWIEDNLDHLICEGIELLHMTQPTCIAMSIECTEFGEVFNDLESHTYNNFYEGYPSEYDKAVKDSAQCAKYLFSEYGLWDRRVSTIEDIGKYNDVLSELVFQIAENFAHAWCEYLGLPYDSHEGVA